MVDYHGARGVIAKPGAVTLSTQGRRGLNSEGSGNYVTIPSREIAGCFRGWERVISGGVGGGMVWSGVVRGGIGATKLSQ